MDQQYRYDVALSFAEEDRDAALALTQALKAQGLTVYYYPDKRADDVGNDIEQRLTNVYAEEAQCAVTLLSEDYFKEEKVYPKIELAAIQSRMEQEPGMAYLVPVKLDEYTLPLQYTFLANRIYLEWNHQPDEIADVLKKLLGKELVSATENADPNSIVYSSGDQVLVIAGSNITEFNQQIIKHATFTEQKNIEISGDNVTTFDGVNVGGDFVGRDVNNNINLNLKSPKEKRFSCPYCDTELDGEKYGKQICPSCKRTFYIRNTDREKDILEYKTLTSEDARKYNKILAHINNNLRDKDYESACKYCQQAEEIAPAEVATWRSFALAEFLLEITKEKSKRKETVAIMRSIKSHIEKCNDHGISEQEYEELVVDIANRLFNIEKARINSVKAQYKDATNGDVWSKSNMLYLQGLLRSYEICYMLYNDSLFLKEYVKELTKDYKWVLKTASGVIINTPTCGNFNAYEKIKTLANRIREKEPDYDIPDIAEERFAVRKSEYFKINSIIPKAEYGETNIAD